MDLSKQEKSEIIAANSSQLLFRNLQRCTVALLVEKPNNITSLGSGTCVKVGAQYFIATAAHVVEEYSVIRIMCGQGPIDLKSKVNYSPRTVCIHSNHRIDVAWLLLDEEIALALEKDFISPNRFRYDVSHKENEAAYMIGFPESKVEIQSAFEQINIRPMGYLTDTKDTSPNLPNGISSFPHHIYLDYPQNGNACSATGLDVDLPPPNGMSGGSFWLLNINQKLAEFKEKTGDGLWKTEDAVLIGIDESWYEPERWVRGTQIKYWVDIVLLHFPELNPFFPDYPG